MATAPKTATNPIHRRRYGWGYHQGKARALKGWAADCPICRKEISDGRYSRKQAKDALYRHMKKQHKPGQVGTP